MIIVLNGPLGIGKSTLAEALDTRQRTIIREKTSITKAT